MELEPVGRVDNPDALDMSPIVVPIVGYTLDKQEVTQRVRFVPVQPAGPGLDVITATGNEDASVVAILRYLEACVLPDDREVWVEFLHRPDVMVEQVTLVKVFQALTEVYAGRPTIPSADSSGGRTPDDTTSAAAARSQDSTSNA
jgi:hypothetical protein